MPTRPFSRRQVLAGTAAAALTPASLLAQAVRDEKLFDISLAQWSLHKKLRAGELKNLDFAAYTANTFGIHAVEYVNSFFKDKATDFDYLGRMKANAEAAGVRSLLIMIDGEGSLADENEDKRTQAIHNHFRWIAAAKFLGCHSIRVNAGGSGDWEKGQALAADSLVALGRIGDTYGINVIVENHGGLSSNGEWLAGVMKRANHPRVGTLPDFGNFRIGGGKTYDRYKGVDELMPYAKAVSAKTHEFDGDGNEIHTDYERMLQIVVEKHGYNGFIGIEYEGGKVGEDEGIKLTRDLLTRVRDKMSS